MLGRKEEADRLIPLCRVLLRQPIVCGRCCGGEAKSAEALRKGRETLSSECLKTMVRLHGEWVRGWPIILLAIQECHRVQGFTKALQ